MFVKPKLNLLFVLDSVPRDQLDEQLLGGSQVKIEEESYPSEKLSFLTSLLSGSQPREHGIVSSAWRKGRNVAEAYLSSSSARQRNNVADIFTLFGGRSLVLSLSADRQLAAAVGPQTSSSADFAAQVYFDAARGLLQSSSPLLSEDFTATAEQLLSSLGDYLTRQLVQSLLPGQLLSVSLLDGRLVFRVKEDDSSSPIELSFAFDDEAEGSFLVELYLSSLLATVGGQEALSSGSTLLPLLALDDAPDFIALSISSVRRLAASTLSDASAKSSFALRLFQRLFLKVRENQSQQYANRVAWQVVVPGAESKVQAHVPILDVDSVSSLLYFPSHFDSSQRQLACASLASLPPQLHGECQTRTDELFVNHHQHLRELMTNGTSGHTAADVFTFHVVLWFLVAVISGLSYLIYFIMNSTSTRESVFVSASDTPTKDY